MGFSVTDIKHMVIILLIQKHLRQFYCRETLTRSFVKIKPLQNGKVTLLITNVGK